MFIEETIYHCKCLYSVFCLLDIYEIICMANKKQDNYLNYAGQEKPRFD